MATDKQLKKQVKELFNQIAILLKNVEHQYDIVYDDDTGHEMENPKYTDENHYLSVAKKISRDLATGNDNNETMQYYSSYCYWD